MARAVAAKMSRGLRKSRSVLVGCDLLLDVRHVATAGRIFLEVTCALVWLSSTGRLCDTIGELASRFLAQLPSRPHRWPRLQLAGVNMDEVDVFVPELLLSYFKLRRSCGSSESCLSQAVLRLFQYGQIGADEVLRACTDLCAFTNGSFDVTSATRAS